MMCANSHAIVRALVALLLNSRYPIHEDSAETTNEKTILQITINTKHGAE